jgi:small subunit ribosomal protein S18
MAMSLERAMTRLSLRPASVCRECRRTFTSPAKPRQQQSAVGAIAGSSISNTTHPARQQCANPSQESLQTTRTATASRQPQYQQSSTSPAVAPVPPQDAFSFANKAVASIQESNDRVKRDEQARTIARGVDRKGLEMQQIRRWNVGDVYAPHDLSGVEQSKWKRLKQSPRPKWDVLDQLNLNPMDHYKVSVAESLERRMERLRC